MRNFMNSINSIFRFFKKSDVSENDLGHQLTSILRITIFFCFVGHGAWGIITKEGWLPFFNSMGIPDSISWYLMPIIGTMDLVLGLIVILRPSRLFLIWMSIWTFWTALLRPLAGYTMWEIWERAGNFFPPIIFIVLFGAFTLNKNDLFAHLKKPKLNPQSINSVSILLRISLFLLLLGHAGFCYFVQKPSLLTHFSMMGFPEDYTTLIYVGFFEFILAFFALFSQSIVFYSFVIFWKVLTELLYPIAGNFIDVFETIERFGDYGVPFAIISILFWQRKNKASYSTQDITNIKMRLRSYYGVIAFTLWFAGISIIDYIRFDTSLDISQSYSFIRKHNKKQIFNRAKISNSKETYQWADFEVLKSELYHGNELINLLKKGGNIVFFRHFATDSTKLYYDKTRIDHGTISSEELLASCEKQRPLSSYGVHMARTVRLGIESLQIPIGEVLSSPYCRVFEGAKLAFGDRVTVKRDLIYRAMSFTASNMMKFFKEEITKPFSGNKIIMAHRTQMDGLKKIHEGEAFVLKILPKNKLKLVGVIQPEEWLLASKEPSLLGLNTIQSSVFSKEANRKIVDRDIADFEEQKRLFRLNK